MSVSKDAKLSDSLIATGFPAGTHSTLPVNMRGLQALAPKVRNVRVVGSAALHLAYVAAGRLSGFWEIGLNSWDIAAGALLVREAGGEVTDTLGRPYTLPVRHVLATNGHIQRELQLELASADATGYEQ